MSEVDTSKEVHDLWHSGLGIGVDYDVDMCTHFRKAGAQILSCDWGECGIEMRVAGISREKVLEAAKYCMEVMPQRKPRVH